MKTQFALEQPQPLVGLVPSNVRLSIIGQRPKEKPYVVIEQKGNMLFVRDQDLERLAINILKALKSKSLNP